MRMSRSVIIYYTVCENTVTIKSSMKENNIEELEKLADEILS